MVVSFLLAKVLMSDEASLAAVLRATNMRDHCDPGNLLQESREW